MHDGLPESKCFALLGDRRRRLVVRVLREHGASLSVTEIAHLVTSYEREDHSAIDAADVHTSLHHTHLPRLEAADVISYDRDERMVELRPNFDSIIRFVEPVAGEDVRWTDA